MSLSPMLLLCAAVAWFGQEIAAVGNHVEGAIDPNSDQVVHPVYKYVYDVGRRGLVSGKRREFGHVESRNGSRIDGSYYQMMPDGRLQTVRYYADDTGYHADVAYDGRATLVPPGVEGGAKRESRRVPREQRHSSLQRRQMDEEDPIDDAGSRELLDSSRRNPQQRSSFESELKAKHSVAENARQSEGKPSSTGKTLRPIPIKYYGMRNRSFKKTSGNGQSRRRQLRKVKVIKRRT